MILIVFTASTREDVTRAESVKEFALVKDLAYSLQSEVNRVGYVEDGYVRGFTLPLTLEGYPYEVTVWNVTLVVNTSGYEYGLSVLPATGNFTPGSNVIKKENGQILINV